MHPRTFPRAAAAAVVGIFLTISSSQADEGMWLFNNPPLKLLNHRYKFEPTKEWLEHVQRASVRFNSGGSGSFVSANGLVMTNHHVGADAMQKLSSKEHDYLKDGFLAKTRDQELKCVDEELNVLMSIEDVTARVNAAVKPEMKPADAFVARRAVISEIEKESLDKTGLRSDVVTLYQGAEYHLYRFKKYTDVRLVFAPEQQIAFFGGDPDNFEYPRYDLDCCFFRIYEDGKPAQIKDYLKWSKSGADENELVFVSGHPGRTDRLATMARLDYLRETGFPYLLQRLYRWEVLLDAWSARDEENNRRAKDFVFSIKNSRKARDGGLAGLLDPNLMRQKREYEEKLRAAVAKDSKLKDAADAWDKIAKAEEVLKQQLKSYTVLERGAGFNSNYFGLARTLVRAAEERAKPNAERMREYGEARLPELEQQLFSTEPIYDDLELVKLADSLTWLAEQLGSEHALTKRVLAGKSPRARAAELIGQTKLKDVDYRKKLFAGGQKAVNAAIETDAMLALAQAVDADSRAVRKIIETQVDEPERQAYAQIAKAKYAVEGSTVYPDATFTLRLAFGVVKGYTENGKKVPFETHYGGLYERSAQHHNKEPFDLPPRWLERKSKVDLQVPLNFVCTCDIIGGNSGSPVINKNAEVVGLIFDGNIQSLVLDFIYTDEQARAVAVHSEGIIEAMRKVYDAGFLADELTGRK